MARVIPISQIFKKASETKSKKERMEFLRQNYSPLMKLMVEAAYHPNVKFILPSGRFAYTPAPSRGENDGKLYFEATKGNLNIFVAGGGADNMVPKRLQNKFVQLLEALPPEDAEMLQSIKDKEMPFPYLTYKFFNETFPGILPEEGEKAWGKARKSVVELEADADVDE